MNRNDIAKLLITLGYGKWKMNSNGETIKLEIIGECCVQDIKDALPVVKWEFVGGNPIFNIAKVS